MCGIIYLVAKPYLICEPHVQRHVCGARCDLIEISNRNHLWLYLRMWGRGWVGVAIILHKCVSAINCNFTYVCVRNHRWFYISTRSRLWFYRGLSGDQNGPIESPQGISVGPMRYVSFFLSDPTGISITNQIWSFIVLYWDRKCSYINLFIESVVDLERYVWGLDWILHESL